MPHTAQVQTNFTAGELSPRVFGRTDLARYKNGAKTLENWLPMVQGGITRRPGFRFVTEAKSSATAVRLIPFEFNTQQTYMLEFGQKASAALDVNAVDQTLDSITFDGNQRFKMQGGHTFVVSGSTDIDGTYTVIESVLTAGPPNPSTKVYVSEAVPGSTADGSAVVTMGYVRFYRDEGQLFSDSPTNATPTEVDSPYTAADLSNIKHIQSNDVLILAHPDYEPHELTRSAGDDAADATWSLSKLSAVDGPYLDENTTATTLTFTTGVVGSDTLTSTTDLFAKTDIGRSVRIRDSTATIDKNIGWAEITDYQTAKIVLVTVKTTCVSDAQTSWSLGAWSQTTGFPATAGFFEERLWFAATANETNALYSSIIGNFRSFRPTKRDVAGTIRYDDGIVAQLNSANAIRWLISDRQGLIVLTDGGLWSLIGISDQLGPRSLDGAAAAANFGYSVREQNRDTVHPLVQPRPAGKVILQIEKGGRRVLQELFTFQDDRFAGTNLNVLADHINVGGLVESALQVRPETRLWLARTDGQLVSMTFDAEQQVVSWARHIVGGDAAGSDQAVVESIATIREENEDQLWAVVKRTINGQTKRYIEFMEEPFDVNTEQELAFFVDSGLSLGLVGATETATITNITQTNPVTVTAAAHGFTAGVVVRIRRVVGMTELNNRSFTIGGVTTNTFTLISEDGTAYSSYTSGGNANQEVTAISGLSHLEGQTVNIMVDGGSHPPLVVTDGAITLDDAASIVHVGLPIESLMTTMPITATTGDEDSRSGLLQLSQVFLIVDRSLGGMVGVESGEYNEIIYREGADELGVAPPLFTGFLDTEF